jgi:hypothetical protein
MRVLRVLSTPEVLLLSRAFLLLLLWMAAAALTASCFQLVVCCVLAPQGLEVLYLLQRECWRVTYIDWVCLVFDTGTGECCQFQLGY